MRENLNVKKIEEIVKWLSKNGYTVNESKRFFEAAQAMIEDAAPVKEIRINSENYLPLSKSCTAE